MLFYLLYESVHELADPGTSYSGTAVLGVGVPLAIALFFLVLGLVLMVVWRCIVGHGVLRAHAASRRCRREIADGRRARRSRSARARRRFPSMR